ncbi:uncharacterized protein LOC141617109 [Silene latifolia]|uniref:uncharacterized protein LOC141617109 n=1 Tax=Silene latifolia TaxID=37657 RepID=UPI003D77CE42
MAVSNLCSLKLLHKSPKTRDIALWSMTGGTTKGVGGRKVEVPAVGVVVEVEGACEEEARALLEVLAAGVAATRGSLLFYDILRKSQKFEWTADHEQALRELKHYLCTPPLLSKQEQGEPLFLYLAVTEVAVSAVLVREQDKEQKTVHYVSKSLLPAETKYTSLEKLVLALVIASYKLRPYFESHTIYVVTNYPLKSVMRKPELSGRMSKWSVHLSGYDIRYDPRKAIKSQALADFVSDFSPAIQNLADEEILTLKGNKEAKVWKMHIDGASNQRGARVGLILRSPQGDLITQAIRCEFKATNNEIEYEALILGMQLALELGVRNLQIFSDSLLIVNHVNDELIARDSKMVAYLKVAKELK